MTEQHKQFLKRNSQKLGLLFLKGLWFVLRSSLYAIVFVIPMIIGRLLLWCLTLGAFSVNPRATTTIVAANEIRKNRKRIRELEQRSHS